jgi:hypothetical protein
MFTYDMFSFIQATFILFILLALGAATLACRDRWPEARKQQWGAAGHADTPATDTHA